MKIAGVDIGPGHPCRTVAEVSNNHNGKYDNAIKLINAAKAAGADFVKFQAYTPAELVALRGDGPAPEPWGSQGWNMRQLYEKAATPLKWFPDLIAHCNRIHLPWFASVFGVGSLTLMDALGCPAFKLAALDFGNRKLLKYVEATGKPVIRSCSMPGAPRRASLALWCPSGYPQTSFVLGQAMRSYDGFSYHGTDPYVPCVAVACGAHIIEAHLQLDEEPSELESNVSLSATQFATMVMQVRATQEVLA